MTFCKLKTSLSSNFVYNLQTFQGFCQVRFTILLQIPLLFPSSLSPTALDACYAGFTVPLFFSPPPKPPPPPKLFWHSCKMAARNAKRSISTILLKNRGLWTVQANREVHKKLGRNPPIRNAHICPCNSAGYKNEFLCTNSQTDYTNSL